MLPRLSLRAQLSMAFLDTAGPCLSGLWLQLHCCKLTALERLVVRSLTVSPIILLIGHQSTCKCRKWWVADSSLSTPNLRSQSALKTGPVPEAGGGHRPAESAQRRTAVPDHHDAFLSDCQGQAPSSQ